jgi:hypothetical protein
MSNLYLLWGTTTMLGKDELSSHTKPANSQMFQGGGNVAQIKTAGWHQTTILYEELSLWQRYVAIFGGIRSSQYSSNYMHHNQFH